MSGTPSADCFASSRAIAIMILCQGCPVVDDKKVNSGEGGSGIVWLAIR